MQQLYLHEIWMQRFLFTAVISMLNTSAANYTAWLKLQHLLIKQQINVFWMFYFPRLAARAWISNSLFMYCFTHFFFFFLLLRNAVTSSVFYHLIITFLAGAFMSDIIHTVCEVNCSRRTRNWQTSKPAQRNHERKFKCLWGSNGENNFQAHRKPLHLSEVITVYWVSALIWVCWFARWMMCYIRNSLPKL